MSREAGGSPEQYLNDPKFVEFLDSYDDDLDFDALGPEQLAERHEAFELAQSVGPEIKKLFKEEIAKQLDIQMDDAEFAAIDEYIQREVRENPEALATIQNEARQYRESKEMIEERELEVETLLAEHGGERKLREKEKLLKEAAKQGKQRWFIIGRFIKPSEDQKIAQEELATRHNVEKDYDKELRKVERILGPLGELREVQKIRQDIWDAIEPARAIMERARELAQEKLQQLGSDESETGTQKALEYLAQLRTLSEQQGTDYLSDFTYHVEYESGDGSKTVELSEDDFEEELQLRIETKVADTLERSIREVNRYDAFAKKMDKIFKDPKVGLRRPGEARTFLIESLRDIAKNVRPGKRAIISMYITQIENTK